MIKKYIKFLKENTIRQNPSVPREYLSKIEREEEMTSDDRGMMFMRELGQLFQQQSRLVDGKEKDLERLAKRIIETLNGDLLKILQVDLEFSLVSQQDIGSEIRKAKEKLESDKSKVYPVQKIGDDENVKAEIAKRDIANLIIQGEAKQIKDVILTNESVKSIIKSDLEEIFGENSTKILEIWTRMLEILDIKDKTTNTDAMGMMISNLPESGLAGFTYVYWEVREQEDYESEYSVEDEEDYQPYTGDESEEDYYEDEPLEPKEGLRKPTVYAFGIDFPMLLHEAQKGIWEFLAVPSLPSDEETLMLVKGNTGPKFEPEGWKYGPRVSKDLMNFFRNRLSVRFEKNDAQGKSDENQRIQEMTNLRQFYFRELLNKDTMPTTDFLRVMKGILLKMTSKADYTDDEKEMIEFSILKSDDIISKLIDRLDYEYKKAKYEEDMKRYEEQMRDYEKKMKEWESHQKSSTTNIPMKIETDVERLKRELKEAEYEENYELAAKLRDELKKTL